jgi:phosphoserine phosphatase
LLTEAAMTGAVPLETVYAKRLDLVRPDRVALAWRCADEVISGAAETVATLRQHGKAVYMVTSGLLQAVAKFAGALGIAPAQVYAVEALLMGFGAYQGFDSSSPLCCSDGKATSAEVLPRCLECRDGWRWRD